MTGSAMAHGVNLPEACRTPCPECPWRRVSAPGHLGPHTAAQWVEIAHGEGAIACHMTIPYTDAPWDHPGLKQCRGAAMFREHVFKSPRNRQIETGPSDPDLVFTWNDEFLKHHSLKETS